MRNRETDMGDDSYEIYALKYALHDRPAADNFIGGDSHDVPMPGCTENLNSEIVVMKPAKNRA
jgi:hypothetical protein